MFPIIEQKNCNNDARLMMLFSCEYVMYFEKEIGN
jgi:hypothetical protein